MNNGFWLVYASSIGKHRVKKRTYLRERFCFPFFQYGAKYKESRTIIDNSVRNITASEALQTIDFDGAKRVESNIVAGNITRNKPNYVQKQQVKIT